MHKLIHWLLFLVQGTLVTIMVIFFMVMLSVLRIEFFEEPYEVSPYGMCSIYTNAEDCVEALPRMVDFQLKVFEQTGQWHSFNHEQN